MFMKTIAVGPFALVESWVTGGTTVAILRAACGSHNDDVFDFVKSVAAFERRGTIFCEAMALARFLATTVATRRRLEQVEEFKVSPVKRTWGWASAIIVIESGTNHAEPKTIERATACPAFCILTR